MKNNNAIKTLNLSGNIMSYTSSLSELIRFNTILNNLNFSTTNVSYTPLFTTEFCCSIMENRSLEELVFNENHYKDGALNALVEAISVNKGLKSLILDECLYLTKNEWSERLGDKGFTNLDVLLQKSTIQTLSLRKNILTKKSVKVIVNGLTTNVNLTKLTLAHNEIDHFGAEMLSGALQSNRTLTHLDMGYNHLGNAGISAFGEALPTNSTLKHLDLRFTEGEDEGMMRFAKSMLRNTSLTHLDLSGNDFRNETCCMFAETLKGNTSLKNLLISSRQITQEVAIAFEDSLRINRTLLHLKFEIIDAFSFECIHNLCDPSVSQIQKLLERNRQLQSNDLTNKTIKILLHFPFDIKFVHK